MGVREALWEPLGACLGLSYSWGSSISRAASCGVPHKWSGEEALCARDLLGSAPSQIGKEAGKEDQKGKEAQRGTLWNKSLRG